MSGPPGPPRALLSLVGIALLACSQATPPPSVAPRPAKDPASASSAARDSALEQRVERLELRLLERDAQIEDLQARLDEARQEVVRTMAKLQTVASRAEAASAMAEAEIAVQSLRAAAGAVVASDLTQASALLQQASVEFGKQNYGGALYLANQTKRSVGAGASRLGGAGAGATGGGGGGGGDHVALRPGEVPFAVPVRLQTTTRGNVREGPGSGYKLLFTLDAGAELIGYSYLEQWVRVADESGRAGWIFLSLIGRREPGAR